LDLPPPPSGQASIVPFSLPSPWSPLSALSTLSLSSYVPFLPLPLSKSINRLLHRNSFLSFPPPPSSSHAMFGLSTIDAQQLVFYRSNEDLVPPSRRKSPPFVVELILFFPLKVVPSSFFSLSKSCLSHPLFPFPLRRRATCFFPEYRNDVDASLISLYLNFFPLSLTGTEMPT